MNLRQLALVVSFVSCAGMDPGGGTGGGSSGAAGGSSGTAGGSGGTAGGAATVDCTPACVTKAQDCGAPQPGAAQFCSTWCGRNPTAAQIACLQGSDCQALMGAAPCGVGGTAGGSGGTAGGSGGTAGGTGGTAGGGPLSCAGKTCKSSSACGCSGAPYCSPDSSACALQCKANGASCFFDSECCNLGCDRNTDTCAACKPGGAACGNQNNNLPCCSGSCVNNQCATCRGPGELCVVNADCCASSYCNSGKCFRRLPDGGIPP